MIVGKACKPAFRKVITPNVADMADIKILAIDKSGDHSTAHTVAFGFAQAAIGNPILSGAKRFYQSIANANSKVTVRR